MSKHKILIVGKGELGTALEKVLSKNEDNDITLWGENPDLPPAEIVFIAVPTFAIEDVANKCNFTQKEDAIVVVLSKGLSNDGKTPLEIASGVWFGNLALVSGPMIAEELSKDKMGYGLVASKNAEVLSKLVSLFKGTNLELTKTNDLVGLSWLGPLKNVYAIGLGYASGQGKGFNYRGAYVTRAIEEMAEIIDSFGGQRKTAYSLAGLGDLIATGFSTNSSNFEYGRRLAQEKKRGIEPEGLTVIQSLKERLDKNYQLLTELFELIDNK